MRTARSSSRLLGVGGGWGCLPQCMLGYTPQPGPGPPAWAWTPCPLGVGLDPPQCGPGPPWVWAWTPRVWAWIPQPDSSTSPLGLGLDTPPGQTPQPPPGLGLDNPPPLDRILDTCFWKYYLAPTSLWAVINHILPPPTKLREDVFTCVCLSMWLLPMMHWTSLSPAQSPLQDIGPTHSSVIWPPSVETCSNLFT